jgi:predicted negative regulator of RcsB-dependent stress response
MPTTQPISRDPTLEAHAFWYKFRGEIAAVIVLVILAVIGLGGYKIYTERRDSAASAMLGAAKTPHDYEQVIAQYPNTAAGASAYVLLAQAQRDQRKFAESSATLQVFIDKNPSHELVPTAQMGIAANLEAMGKTDEALARYQDVAAKYPNDFNAPLALISQVPILKAKNQADAARRICETVLMKYRFPGDQRPGSAPDDRIESFWAADAMRELRSMKPPAEPAPPAGAPGTGTAPSAGQPPLMLRPPPAAVPGAAPTVQPTKPK